MPAKSTDGRWVALAVLCAGMLMIVLDATVVNVALPSIQSDLGFSQSDLAWVVNAYMITFGGLLLLAGRLGDLIGSKRVFVAGIAVFTLASLLCGASISREMLVAARFLQGVGGAMASAVILSVIVIMFEDSHDRAKAMNMFSFTASAGGSIGLLVGGALTQAANWHWVFLVNIPIGIVVLVLANRVLAPGTALGLRAGADALGAFLITASLMLAVYAVVEIPVARATSPQTLLTGTLALALFAAFIARQAMAAKPLLPLGVFRNRNLSGSNVLQVLLVAGLYGFFFLDSLYLRQQLHYSAFTTGLAFLPITIAIGALSLGWSTHLVTHFGARNVIVAGVSAAAAGLAMSALAPLSANYATIFPVMVLLGVGLGVSFPSLMMFAMSSATPSDSGLISGLTNTTAEVGGALGLAILATVASSAGYHVAFGVAAAFLVAASLIAATVLEPEALEELQAEPITAA